VDKKVFSVIGKSISVLHFQKQKNVASLMLKYGLHSPSYGFLMYLRGRDGITQRELCSLLGVDDAMASRAMGTLVKKGFIVRKRSSQDARSYELYLTEKAKKVIPELQKSYEEWWEKLCEGIADRDMKTLCILLQEITEKATGQELFPGDFFE
jgi:DNA-binding MarR family transcriptional regulator